eukprot:3443362-Lingulodinium_polyedra.AAC.1
MEHRRRPPRAQRGPRATGRAGSHPGSFPPPGRLLSRHAPRLAPSALSERGEEARSSDAHLWGPQG